MSYGPKEKYLARLLGDPDLKRPAMVLPRMSFEINSLNYNADNKLATTGKIARSGKNNSVSTIYNPVPYDFQISLYIMVKNAEDGTRIVEQIVPFFTPSYTLSIKVVPQMDISHDIPITLNSVTSVDTYDEAFTERRAIIWTLNFTLKGYLYGPVKDNASGIIKKATINFFAPTTNTAFEGIGITPLGEGFILTPGVDANGNPTTNASVTINYSDVQIGTPYDFIYEFFSDD